MATIEELKEMIVDLMMEIVEKDNPEGFCPYSNNSYMLQYINCAKTDCDFCRETFFECIRQKMQREVDLL